MLIAFITCLAGFTALALSRPKHARDVLGHRNTPNRRRLCRIAGWGLLALSVILCLAAWGSATGWVAWFGLATAAAFLVTLALTSATYPAFFSGKYGSVRKNLSQNRPL